MDAVTLSANGKTYTLRPLGTNALCALEERLGKPFGTLMSEIGVLGIEQMHLSTVRIFLQECLADPTPETEIGDLIDAVGFDGISKKINGDPEAGDETPGLIWPARKVAA